MNFPILEIQKSKYLYNSHERERESPFKVQGSAGVSCYTIHRRDIEPIQGMRFSRCELLYNSQETESLLKVQGSLGASYYSTPMRHSLFKAQGFPGARKLPL